ncbi:hypothetical protein C0992_007158 [Termitomyces sp. T32_za158]|nr:hypothetical protein C0992_007158 [Termitomyces sp. T32_za158]
MLSSILRRLRRRQSQTRVVLVPPELNLRDSFASPFPHVSEGGYTLYYELELLQRKRTEKEKHNITISATKSLRTHALSYSQAQTPGASSSRHRQPLKSMPQYHQQQDSRRHGTTKSTGSHRLGLEKIPEMSPGRPHRSVRKRKKMKNLRQVMETQAAEQQRIMMSLTELDTPGTALSRLASSSCGHGTMDTPPKTVEDFAEDEFWTIVNFKNSDDRSDSERVNSDSSDPFGRPLSTSSYHTARSHLSDL